MLFIAAVLVSVALTILICGLAMVFVAFLVMGAGWLGTVVAAAGSRRERDGDRTPHRKE